MALAFADQASSIFEGRFGYVPSRISGLDRRGRENVIALIRLALAAEGSVVRAVFRSRI